MRIRVVFSIAVAVFFISQNVFGQASVHGVLKVVKGDVKVKSASDGKEAKVKVGQKVFPGDTITAGKDSRAKIIMVDNNEINVTPDTQMRIQDYEYKPGEDKKNVLLNVLYGKVRAKVNQKYDDDKNKFQVKTPSAVAGVRGTDFLTGYQPSTRETQVVTFEGNVNFGQFGNGQILNAVSVRAGQMTTLVSGRAPAPPVEIPKTELAKMDNESNAGGRGPASVTGPGDGFLRPEDLPNDNPDVDKQPSGPPPPPPPPPPGVRPCPNCEQLLQNKQRQLNIKVRLQGPEGPAQ